MLSTAVLVVSKDLQVSVTKMHQKYHNFITVHLPSVSEGLPGRHHLTPYTRRCHVRFEV